MPQRISLYFSAFLFLGFFSLVFILAVSSYAQEKITENDLKISQKEKAVLGFFRLAGVAPDYETWIKAGNGYQEIENDKEKQKFLIAESLRLGQNYSLYNPAKELLEFNTEVIASYSAPRDGKSAFFHFKFPDQTEDFIPVFEFPYGDNSIALVLNRFAEFSTLPLTLEQFEKISKAMPYEDEEYSAKLSLEVRLTQADMEKPIIRQGRYQWMMLGEIAHIRCQIIDPTTLRLSKLWDYVAPWYEKEYYVQTIPEEQKYPHPYDLFKDKK